LPREFLVANGAFQLAVEKIARPARLCRIGEMFSDAQFDCFRARDFPIEPGFDDLLALAVPTPMSANDAIRLTFHYGSSNSMLNGFPAPVDSWAAGRLGFPVKAQQNRSPHDSREKDP
jgi:hypothetical protein